MMKKNRAILSVISACSLLFASCRPDPSSGDYRAKEGDLVFQSLPHLPLVDAIEGSTGSPYSHCGILHLTPQGWVVIEAIGPVKETPLSEWIAQSRDGGYDAYRLHPEYQYTVESLISEAKKYEGLPYDIHYDFDDSSIYCSELIFKSFKKVTGEDLGKCQTLGSLNWKPYASVIREIENGKLPLDRLMITPQALSEARQLRKVYSSKRS